MSKQSAGRIVKVAGPDVDVEFPPDALPEIHDAIEFEFELGALERDAEGEALPLAILFSSTPLENDELPAGFHWRE